MLSEEWQYSEDNLSNAEAAVMNLFWSFMLSDSPKIVAAERLELLQPLQCFLRSLSKFKSSFQLLLNPIYPLQMFLLPIINLVLEIHLKVSHSDRFTVNLSRYFPQLVDFALPYHYSRLHKHNTELALRQLECVAVVDGRIDVSCDGDWREGSRLYLV